MSQPSPSGPASSVGLEQQVRARIESLSYLPTTASVAMKFMELGKDLDSDPCDYAKVISSDSSLSTKLLGLANSSWFGVRNRVTKVQVAVNLLGLGTVRTLAISYCVTGLHNELKLKPAESRMFWASSLSKAVAAREFASLFDKKLAEEAFAAGLFQDFALPVMYSTARQQVTQILEDANLDAKARQQRERELFKLDHAEIGRSIAQKLELPDLFVDAVAFHHDHANLRELIGNPVIADSIYVSSLFPHRLEAWNRTDAAALTAFITEQAGGKVAGPQAFLEQVQKEFAQLYGYFEQGEAPEKTLPDLLAAATKEAADTTTRLVTTVYDLMQQAANAGHEVHQLMRQTNELEAATLRDSLTGALNREGFMKRAGELLANASRYGMSYAVAFLDVDQFKRFNDDFSHAVGDAALKAIVAAAQKVIRPADILARLGGDEFAILIKDCAENDAGEIVERIVAHIGSERLPSTKGAAPKVTASAGVLWIPPRSPAQSVEQLLTAADALMYESKRAGGDRITRRSLGSLGLAA